MTQKILLTAFLAAFMLAAGAVAHEGDHHQVMGTVEAIDAEQITVAIKEGESETFKLTEETSFTRGEAEVTREELAIGERTVVMYETRDEISVAIEIMLSPKAE